MKLNIVSSGDGLPADLSALLAQIESEAFDYADRARDIKGVRSWIERGDFDMGRSTAKGVVERQQQLRQAEQNGLPTDLSALLAQIESEAFDYADRARDIKGVRSWIERGDFDMGRSTAKSVLERQRNLKAKTASD